MSTNGSTNAIELDMRHVLRAKKQPDVSKGLSADYSSLVTQISGQSVQQIDHLIVGLQGIRAKLNNDCDRLHREIEQHTAFTQSIIQLTEIVADSLASVSESATGNTPPEAA